MQKYENSLVVGKFYPPHNGHLLLIKTAIKRSKVVHVIIEKSGSEDISLKDRKKWLQEELRKNNVVFYTIKCDCPVDMHDESIWEAQIAIMKEALKTKNNKKTAMPKINAVFSSENYGAELAKRFGAVHEEVDLNRENIPVSGTKVRDDLTKNWWMLPKATKKGLSSRIILVGSESTGKTTLSKILQEEYRLKKGYEDTKWVKEIGRDYTVEKWNKAKKKDKHILLEDLLWDETDFIKIAKRQTRLEEKLTAESSPLLICDTDSLATLVWQKRYLKTKLNENKYTWSKNLPGKRLYLLTDHEGVPFEDDGLRGEEVKERAEMTNWFAKQLTKQNESWVMLTGDFQSRKTLATKTIDLFLNQSKTFKKPII